MEPTEEARQTGQRRVERQQEGSLRLAEEGFQLQQDELLKQISVAFNFQISNYLKLTHPVEQPSPWVWGLEVVALQLQVEERAFRYVVP